MLPQLRIKCGVAKSCQGTHTALQAPMLYGPFDLGMHDFMDEEFEFEFREEEFSRKFPAVVPLDHTLSTQRDKTYIVFTYNTSVVRNDKC